jgi:hypothetical protein
MLWGEGSDGEEESGFVMTGDLSSTRFETVVILKLLKTKANDSGNLEQTRPRA